MEPNTSKTKTKAGEHEPERNHTNGVEGSTPVAGETKKAKSAWTEVQLDRPLYKPDTCRKTAIQGFVLDLVAMPENENGPWSCFVIELTEPCLAVDGIDPDAEPIERAIGTEVLLNSTVKLRTLDRFLHPKFLCEVRVQPTTKEKLSGGRSMWLYRVDANRETVKPRPATAQITAHSRAIADHRREKPADDGIPF